MKYHIFILIHRSDSAGFFKAWYLVKPSEMIKDYESFPPGMELTYDGFDTVEKAQNWIMDYGNKDFELHRSSSHQKEIARKNWLKLATKYGCG